MASHAIQYFTKKENRLKTLSTNSFLIIGAQRSGTSLLTRILNQHPQLAVPPESFFFNTFVPLQRFYGDLDDNSNLDRFIDDVLATPKVSEWSPTPTRPEILARLSARNQGAVFTALMETWAESQGKSKWGEKTPHHVFFWSEICEYLPDAPVVHIVRDGRDVALGLINARFGPKSVYAGASRWSRWMTAIDQIRDATPAERFHQISYEDLLLTPEETVGGICDFLGVDYDSRMLEFHNDQSLYSGYAAEHANLNKPLLTDKVAGWRRNMRESDIAVFESIAAAHLEQYGYPVTNESARLSGLQHLYYKWIDDKVRKAVGLLRNRQGQSEELRLLWMRMRLLGRYLVSRPRA